MKCLLVSDLHYTLKQLDWVDRVATVTRRVMSKRVFIIAPLTTSSFYCLDLEDVRPHKP